MHRHRTWAFLPFMLAVSCGGDEPGTRAGNGWDASIEPLGPPEARDGGGGAPGGGGAAGAGGAGASSAGVGGRSDGGAGGTRDGGPGARDGADGTPPGITGLSWVQNPMSALSGFVELTTDEVATLTLTIGGEGGATRQIEPPTAGTSHSVRVLGLRPEQTVTITVMARDAGGNESQQSLVATAGALPGDFPPVAAVRSSPATMQPGWTVFGVFRWTPNLDEEWGYLVGLDESGHVVWYLRARRPADVRQLSNGNIAYVEGDEAAVEVDVMGAEVARWVGEDMGIDTLHHELFELPGGTFATLGTELRVIDGYPGADGGTVAHDVVGDVVVEFDRAATVLRRHSTFDLIDPLRTRPGFNAPFWDTHYASAVGGTKDWTHSNAVIHDASDDGLIVSVRHQDWILKVDRLTGALRWRLGEGGDFSLNGAGSWPYHAHAPELAPNGNLLVYDNGNGRPGGAFTRVVEYALDTSADAGGADGGAPPFVATQVWEYRGQTTYHAPFVGDADRQDNGNVLITDGGLVSNQALSVLDPTNQKSARIREVTTASTSSIVFEVFIQDDATVSPVGYSVYRSERLRPFE